MNQTPDLLYTIIQKDEVYKEIYKLGYDAGKNVAWEFFKKISTAPKYFLHELFGQTSVESIMADTDLKDISDKMQSYMKG